MIRIKLFSKCGNIGCFLGVLIILSCLLYAGNSYSQDQSTIQINEDEAWDRALQANTPTETPYTSTPTPSQTGTPTETYTPTATPTNASSALVIVTIPPQTPISEDIVIRENEIWVIEPGSIYNFHEEINGNTVTGEYDPDRPEIIVYGRMIADASGGDSIVFKAVTAIPTPVDTPVNSPTPINTPIAPPTFVIPTATSTPTKTPIPTRTPNDEFIYTPTGVPIDIPDVTPSFIISTIRVNSSGEVTDVNVPIDITHPAIEQLMVTLSHGSTEVVLHNGANGDHSGQSNMLWTYDDEGVGIDEVDFPPDDIDLGVIPDGTGELSDFDGQGAAGDWILTISDNVLDLTGTLNYWELIIKETNFASPIAPLIADSKTDKLIDSQIEKAGSQQTEIFPGKWYGIRFMDSARPGSILRNVDISGAINALEMDKVSVPVMDSNIHHNSHHGILLKEDSYPVIKGNRFTDNNVDGIRIEENCSPIVYDNFFKDNFDYGLHTLGISAPVITKDNVFSGNRIGIYIDDHSKPHIGDINNNRVVDASGELLADDGYNTFTNNYAYDIYNNNRNIIKAQNNFWGTFDEDEVDSRIFDDNENYGFSGQVEFLPLGQYVDPNSTPTPTKTPVGTFTPVKTPTSSNFTATPTNTPTPYTEITGQINEDQVWTGLVVLNGNVTVPRGISVNVRPGTIVKGMDNQTFLTVYGSLYVQGDEGYDGRVKFVSMNDGQNWGGIIIRNSHYIESAIQNAYFKYCTTAITIDNSCPTLGNITFEGCNAALNIMNIPLNSDTSPSIRKCWFKNNTDAVLIQGETTADLGLNGDTSPGLNVFHNNIRDITVVGDDLHYSLPAEGNYFSIIDNENNFVRIENVEDLQGRVSTNIVDVEPFGNITDGMGASSGSIYVMNSVITPDKEEIWSGVVEIYNHILIQGKLTILEGTEIIVRPAWDVPINLDDYEYKRLTIDVQGGTLIAKGFGQADIDVVPPENEYTHFHSGSNPDEVSPYDWGGIRFLDGSDSSVLEYVKIEDCKVGVSVFKSSPTISHVIFNNIGDRSIYITSEDTDVNIPDYISITKAYVDPNTPLMPGERYTLSVDVNYGLNSVPNPGETYGTLRFYIFSNPLGELFSDSFRVISGDNIDKFIVPDSVVIPLEAQTITVEVYLYNSEGYVMAQNSIQYKVYIAPTPTPVPDTIEITSIEIDPDVEYITPGESYSFDISTGFYLMPGEGRFLDYRVVTDTGFEVYKYDNRFPLTPDSATHAWTIPSVQAPEGYDELIVLAELYDKERFPNVPDEGTLLRSDSVSYPYEPTPTPIIDRVQITDIKIEPDTSVITPNQSYTWDVTTSLFLEPGKVRFIDYRVITDTNDELYRFSNRIPLIPDSATHTWTIPSVQAPEGYDELIVLAELYDEERFPGMEDEGILLSFDSVSYPYDATPTPNAVSISDTSIATDPQDTDFLTEEESTVYKAKSSYSFMIPEPVIQYCRLEGDDYALYCNEAAPILEGNSFDKYKRAGIYMKGAFVPNLGTIDIHNNLEAGGNSFNDLYSEFNLWNDSENPVKASANYWGSADIYSIDQKIFDNEENVYSGPVEISGYLYSTEMKFTAGDLNKDFAVNTVDLLELMESWHKTIGDSHFKTNADMNFDYTINYKDLMILTGILSGK